MGSLAGAKTCTLIALTFIGTDACLSRQQTQALAQRQTKRASVDSRSNYRDPPYA